MKAIIVSLALLTLCGADSVTLAADPSRGDLSLVRGRELLANIESFQLQLSYSGESGKPYYQLFLSVAKAKGSEDTPFYPHIQIDKTQATKIIEHLAHSGTLAGASVDDNKPSETTPAYTLRLATDEQRLVVNLGWSLEMFKQLDGLRTVLEGDAAKRMDLLLGRLSGHRRLFEADAKP